MGTDEKTIRPKRKSTNKLTNGSTVEFEVTCLDPSLEGMVRECLDYGQLRGLGQWRNSGKGRYVWEEIEE